jgi:cell division protein FtsQ
MSKAKWGIAAFVGTVAVVAVLFLFSPVFHITEIIVYGHFTIEREEIIERLDISNTQHILLFNLNAAGQRVMENFYIGSVEIERQLPGRILVTVRERRLTAYAEHLPESILYLDDHGRVIDIRPYALPGLPRLEGLAFTRFMLGEILEVPDPVAFGAIVLYTQLLIQHGLIDRVTHMNVSDASNIRIYIYNIEFNVGDARNADEKVRTILEVLYNTPNIERIVMTIDMRVWTPQIVGRILP